MTVAKPLADWSPITGFDALRSWIVSLRPYPTLALFMIRLSFWNRSSRAPPIWPPPARQAGVADSGRRRVAQARAGRAHLRHQPRQADADSGLRLGLSEYCEITNWLKAPRPGRPRGAGSKLAQYTVRGYAMHLKDVRRSPRRRAESGPAAVADGKSLGGAAGAALSSPSEKIF